MKFLLLLGRLLFIFLFFFGLRRASAVYGPESTEAFLAKGTITLKLGLGFHRKASPRDRIQPGTGDGFARKLTDTVNVFLNALEGFFDLVDCILIRRKQTQRKVTVEIVGA
jgi:hypothetical protein